MSSVATLFFVENHPNVPEEWRKLFLRLFRFLGQVGEVDEAAVLPSIDGLEVVMNTSFLPNAAEVSIRVSKKEQTLFLGTFSRRPKPGWSPLTPGRELLQIPVCVDSGWQQYFVA